MLFYFDRIVHETKNNPDGVEIFKNRIEQEFIRDGIKRNEFIDFIKKNKIENKSSYLRHHECHGYSVYCLSEFKNALIVTVDGRGDFEAITISQIRNGKIKTVYRSSSNDSLGYFHGFDS